MKPLARKLKISWPDFPLNQSCERVFRLGWTSTSVYFALSVYPIHRFPSAVIPLNLSLENSKRLFSETLMPNSTDSSLSSLCFAGTTRQRLFIKLCPNAPTRRCFPALKRSSPPLFANCAQKNGKPPLLAFQKQGTFRETIQPEFLHPR